MAREYVLLYHSIYGYTIDTIYSIYGYTSTYNSMLLCKIA